MIGSHDSFTYQEPISGLMRKFTRFWKCQSLSLNSQYELGVRYFDIRVFEKDNVWGICHQSIEFPDTFPGLKSLILHFKEIFPDAYIRLLLDKGDSLKFKNTILDILREKELYPNLDFVAIFHNNSIGIRTSWEILNPSKFVINEDNVFHVPKNIKWYNVFKLIKKYNIKKQAAKNQKITKDMIDDNKTVYLYDYPELSI